MKCFLLQTFLQLTAVVLAVRNFSFTKMLPQESLVFKTIKEILQGPLSDKWIFLYFDSTILSSLVTDILSLESKRGYRIFSTDFGGKNWREMQPSSIFGEPDVVHIVMFSSDPCLFLKRLSKNRPKPETVLLFSLLNDEELISTFGEQHNHQYFRRLTMLKLRRNRIQNEVKVDIYKAVPFSLKKWKFLGFWGPGTFRTFSDLLPDIFQSFKGHRFSVTANIWDFPFVYSTSNSTIQFKGAGIDMLNTISQQLNFTYDIKNDLEGYWGFYANGSWHGLLGGVERGENDLVINKFLLTEERSLSFDAGVTYMMEGFGVSLLEPPPLPKWFSVIYPFGLTTWIFILITLLLSIAAMTVQDEYQPVAFLRDREDAWLYMFRGTFNQGVPIVPNAHWQRIFLIFWYVYCYVVTVAYSSNLIAYLTVAVPPRRIQSIMELAESDYRLGLEDYGSFLEGGLRKSPDATYQRLGKKLDLFQSLEDLLERVDAGSHAYVDGYSYVLYVLAVHKRASKTYLLPSHLYPGSMCWYYRLGTPWKYRFDDVMTRIVEAGIFQHWMKDHYNTLKATEDGQAGDSDDVPLSLEHLALGFFILVTSWVLSLLVFLAELRVGCIRQR